MKLIDPWTSPYKSKQGNIGLGKAISLFTMAGITVLLPLNDTQDYDLVIDFGKLLRVSVKTSRALDKGKNNYVILLKRCGGNINKVKNFNSTTSDLLLCYTKSDTIYLIPTNVIQVKTSLTLNKSLDKYKVFSEGKLNSSALEEILNVEAP